MKSMLRAAWDYRSFIASSIQNDLRSRFAQSKLGALWMVLQPLAMVSIYALVLSEVLGARLPGIDSKYAYSIYLVSGMVFWSLFAEIVLRCLTVFVDNGNVLKKIVFPRVCLPLIVVGSSLVNNLLLIAATLVVLAMLGHLPTVQWLWLPALVALTSALALGFGLLLGALNVFVRDVAQVMQVVLQLWFWLTPIVYMPQILPERFAKLLGYNPLVPLASAYQNVIAFHRAPDPMGIAWLVLSAVGLLALALLVFRRSSAEMVDVL